MAKIGPGLFRLFLAALVVLHHSFPLRLGTWAVYVFFILSGYWICRLWRQRYAHTDQPFLTFMVSRWWRLAPIFLLCTALNVGSEFLLNGRSALHLASDFVWWLRQLLIAGSNGAGTDLPPSWSLDVEMQFYLGAPLLIMIFGRIKPVLRCLVAAAGCGWLALFIFRSGGNFHWDQLSLFAGFFLIGVILEMGQWKPSPTMAVGSLLTFFAITLILALYPPSQRGFWIVGLSSGALPFAASAWMILGSAMIIPFLAWNVSQKSSRFDRTLGNLAYPLYLFHWIPREWYYHFSLRSDPLWQQDACLALNFLAAAAGAVVIFFLVDRPSERLREAWVASRKKKPTPSENFFTGSAQYAGFRSFVPSGRVTGRRVPRDKSLG